MQWPVDLTLMLASKIIEIEGFCYQSGRSSIKSPALLCGTESAYLSIELQAPDGLKRLQASLNEVEVSEAVGNIPRTLTFSQGWVFVAKDSVKLNSYLDIHLKTGWVSRLEGRRRWIAAAAVGTVLFVLGAYYYGVPALTNSITAHLPAVAYEKTEQQALFLLDKALFKPTQLSAEQQEKLLGRFNGMIKKVNLGEHAQPKLIFREMGTPNAMALANGTVVVTDELIDLLETDEQVDAVIYHELGHVHHAHVMESVVRSSLVSLGLALLVGDASNIADVVSGGASFVLTMNYSREMEREADEFSAKQLKSQTGTVQPLAEAFRLLKMSGQKNGSSEEEQSNDWLDSHPDTDTRIAHILSFE